MTLRETIYTVTNENRDKGKVFKLTEMDAAKAEELSLRAVFLLEGAGLDMPELLKGAGALAVATAGFKVFCQRCSFEDVKPILDEMWKCIEFVPDPRNHNVSHPVLPNEIEEVMTRINLRMEVFKLHMDFLPGGGDSTSTETPIPTNQPSPPKSRTMSTSRARLAQSSALAALRS